ncbi:hypothetical protein [Mycobacterium sp. SMC-17]|uniref:hypothetical protein n=1 Tax=Mycobacterium sp. SMC-17 TaxID=3381628 RepID=UPI00387760D1
MSRTQVKKSNAGRKPKPPPRQYCDYTEEERAARLTYSEIPNNAGSNAAAQRITALWGFEVSRHTIERDTENRSLTMHLIAGRRHYSDRALYDYVILNSSTTAPRRAKVGV